MAGLNDLTMAVAGLEELMTKKLRIEPVEGTTMVRIAYEGGGEVPDALKGSFTNATIAKQFIASHLAAHPEKAQEDVEIVKRDERPAQKPKSMTPL